MHTHNGIHCILKDVMNLSILELSVDVCVISPLVVVALTERDIS